MKNWIHDYETLPNCFIAVFEDYKTDESHIFVVHKLRNDFKEFIDFLQSNIKNGEWHISFNGLAFDSQVTNYILDNADEWMSLPPEEIAYNIQQYASNIIEKANKKQFLDYPEWKQRIRQIDLFKLNHWDNPAKSSSLKWIQYSMDWYNVQEMPIHHTAFIETQEQIDMIVSYCINDVQSTKAIYNRSKDQIALRGTLSSEYKINLYSASEPRISKELFGHFLSEELNIDKRDLKKLRTKRDKIVLKDIILPYIKFTTPEFQTIHEKFLNETIIVDEKGKLNFSQMVRGIGTEHVPIKGFHAVHKGVRSDYGLGGIHGMTQPGIYESKNGMIIMSSDVVSFYPNLAIENQWAPAQFPKEPFSRLYRWFFDERVKIPKKDPKNYVYKIILNSTYGLSNDANCFLYDPEFTMRITINGQLSLTMLYEMLSTRIKGSIPLMQNTDGFEMMIAKQDYDLYMSICEEWQTLTRLKLEHDQYEKLILADVNNYMGINKEKKLKSKEDYDSILADNPFAICRQSGDDYYYKPVKCKGRFEFQNLALHKNKSHLIVPKALYAYFTQGVKPEAYLKSNRNIFDYCAGAKIKGNWYFEARYIDDGKFRSDTLQKLLRYYISKSGVKLIKCNKDGREIQLESGKWMSTIFNLYVDKSWNDYNVDEDYYLNQIYQEINNIDTNTTRHFTQLTMF